MKKLFTSIALLCASVAIFAAENLFNPATAFIDPETGTYFAPNWNQETNSKATYDAATGTVTVDLKSQFYGQWQAQVKLTHDIAFDPTKKYELSCKFLSTGTIGGITVKMDDNAEVVMANMTVDLTANVPFTFSQQGNGVAGNNKVLVFDFGWAGPSKVTISDITITVVGDADVPEPVEHPAAAPVPTLPAAQVFSIYSDAYTSTVARATGGWGQSTREEEVALAAGDNAFYYSNGNYLGWELNGNTTIGDMSKYPMLHMDIYVPEAGSIQFTPIWTGVAEVLKTYTLAEGWNAIDVDLKADFPAINFQDIIQLKWAAMPAICYIDNVYFYNKGGSTDFQAVMNDVSVPARKVFKNGVLCIEQGGQVYTVFGTAL